jgi:hypothetical protein
MNRQRTYATLDAPTLVDADGLRHIIPGKNQAALCGATGEQERPRQWRARDLCQRCVQKYMRGVLDIKLQDFGL